jgi:hypothetical protein
MNTKLSQHRSSVSVPDEIKRLCEEANRASEKLERERGEMNFSRDVKAAVQARLRRVRQHSGAVATMSVRAEDDESSFAQRLKKAAQRRSTRKRHEEQAERERARYKLQPRPHTKSD